MRGEFLISENMKLLKSKDSTQQFIYDYEYFLAVMKKTFIENSESSAISEINKVIQKFQISNLEIDRLMGNLVKSQDSIAYDGRGELKQTITILSLGTAGLSVEGYLLYELLDNL
jgi:glutamate synthase domain-containing protein 3